jgi:hypothetical protein
MKRGWVVAGWLAALVAAALPALWSAARKIEENPLGKYVDAATGAWTARVYWHFLMYWLPIAVPVSLLALACMFLNRPANRS